MLNGYAVFWHGADLGEQFGDDERVDLVEALLDGDGAVTVMVIEEGSPVQVLTGDSVEVGDDFSSYFAGLDADDRDA